MSGEGTFGQGIAHVPHKIEPAAMAGSAGIEAVAENLYSRGTNAVLFPEVDIEGFELRRAFFRAEEIAQDVDDLELIGDLATWGI